MVWEVWEVRAVGVQICKCHLMEKEEMTKQNLTSAAGKKPFEMTHMTYIPAGRSQEAECLMAVVLSELRIGGSSGSHACSHASSTGHAGTTTL